MSTSEDSAALKFIVDHNVAKLARWLRMMGYDTVIFDQPDDWQMVRTALAENRIVITKDTGVMKRRIFTSGKLKAFLVRDDDPEVQIQQVVKAFRLTDDHPFTRCIECNNPLIATTPEAVKARVPAYVFKTQTQYVECPACRRVFWRGTHWQAMLKTLDKLKPDK